ncbi:hypothetical protein C7999DRAFT_10924 [Corynascus novoguineensis]|uniref:Uncharacterized protein n=1 Tax=Corynascus novoguineensis TaxID=1126955 RepID=A0AAN7D009_9PEZI|nr:hypothetical protein C7999DRAFT_10924 [Corynascus novoguineensis]
MCDKDPDTSLFCSPRSGAQLQVGETVDITWDPDFFTSELPPPPHIFIQAEFAVADNGPPATAGFISSPVDPDAGSFRWAVLDAYLPPNSSSTSATLSIAAPLPRIATNGTFFRIGAGTMRYPGPQVDIFRRSSSGSSSSDTNAANPAATGATTPSSTASNPAQNALAIALPVALGVLTAIVMAVYAVVKRRRPHLLASLAGMFPCVGNSDNHPGKGGSENGPPSATRRRVKGRDVEIRVVRTDGLEGRRGGAAPIVAIEGGGGGGGHGTVYNGGGRLGGGETRWNVFREEVRRQEVDRNRGMV